MADSFAVIRGECPPVLIAIGVVAVMVIGGLNLSGSLVGGPRGGDLSPGVPAKLGETPTALSKLVNSIPSVARPSGSTGNVPRPLVAPQTSPPLPLDPVAIPVGDGPYAIAVDAQNGEIYVANYYSDNVSVISGATDRIVGVVDVGSAPISLTLDPLNGDIYVANSGSANVSVVSGSTNLVVATVPVGTGPGWAGSYLAVDAATGDVYVPNYNSANVSVISGTTNKVIASVGVGAGPRSTAFDSANGEVYVLKTVSDNVTAISGASNLPVATIPVGQDPDPT
jgi:YVTN family beta-propeller protein